MFKPRYSKHSVYTLACAMLLLTTGCYRPVEVEPENPQSQDTVIQVQRGWTVSTFAGTGVRGYADGADSAAKFDNPSFLIIDTSGDMFVSDVQNFLIRKISGGRVTTFAGRGVTDPEPGFGHIFGLAVDKQNNLYDIEYSLIRKFTSATSSYVFAGSLHVFYKDASDTAARFNTINKMATDKDGNLYVPDYDMNVNFHIRKISPQGVVSTIRLQDNTGIPTGSNSNSFYLSPVAVDSTGNIYFTANESSLIKKADPQGNVTVFAGAKSIGFADGKGTAAQFNFISELTVDNAGNVYVVEIGNHAIRKVTPEGEVSTIAGKEGRGFKDGPGATARFSFPSDIVIDKNGILYVADAGNNRIRKLEYK